MQRASSSLITKKQEMLKKPNTKLNQCCRGKAIRVTYSGYVCL